MRPLLPALIVMLTFSGFALAQEPFSTPFQAPAQAQPQIPARPPVQTFVPVQTAPVAQTPPAMITDQQRFNATNDTANNSPHCKALFDFYWEIGDAGGIRGNGIVGGRFPANLAIPLSSASEWLFSTYYLEKVARAHGLTQGQLAALQMRSGFINRRTTKGELCGFALSVGSCFEDLGMSMPGADYQGSFYFDPGHAQKLAVDAGLGRLFKQPLADEMRMYLGKDLGFTYTTPLAGNGILMTPLQYGRLLRGIVAGSYLMKNYLGAYPVCSLHSPACPDAQVSAVPFDWHYSVGHYVEDGAGDDGAFSAPGLHGFYPWITADKQSYGIIARNINTPDAPAQSIACGQALRHAWATATVQP